ncbi:helix-turn-helix domain-containing protein [Xanthomonas campestris]|uniref:helix-turn-helix domain-containing protein n=1 Tax=Xanthomonas campestris TaxID=339 RepID=UPI00069974E1|nr:helix-turn-helix transcriptional regulator [Xanthomonas campestris]
MADMHDSMRRLYKAAAALSPPISGQSELARRVGQSPQTVNNWEARGISAAGATKVQQMLGISSTWTREGIQPMFVSQAAPASPQSHSVTQQRQMMAATVTLLRHIEDNVLEPIPEERRAELIDLVTDEVIERWTQGIASADLRDAGKRVLNKLRSGGR